MSLSRTHRPAPLTPWAGAAPSPASPHGMWPSRFGAEPEESGKTGQGFVLCRVLSRCRKGGKFFHTRKSSGGTRKSRGGTVWPSVTVGSPRGGTGHPLPVVSLLGGRGRFPCPQVPHQLIQRLAEPLPPVLVFFEAKTRGIRFSRTVYSHSPRRAVPTRCPPRGPVPFPRAPILLPVLRGVKTHLKHHPKAARGSTLSWHGHGGGQDWRQGARAAWPPLSQRLAWPAAAGVA